MKTRQLPLLALLLMAFSTAACGGDPRQQLGAAALDSEVGEDPPQPSPQEVWARPTGPILFCVVAPCPSFTIRGVNGLPSGQVYAIDLAPLSLPPESAAALEADLLRTLVRGRYAERPERELEPLVFEVTEAYPAISQGAYEDPATDSYYIASAGCPDGSCINARRLGSQEERSWTGLDLQLLQLSPKEEQMLMLQLRAGSVLLATRGQDSPTGAAIVTQAFQPLAIGP